VGYGRFHREPVALFLAPWFTVSPDVALFADTQIVSSGDVLKLSPSPGGPPQSRHFSATTRRRFIIDSIKHVDGRLSINCHVVTDLAHKDRAEITPDAPASSPAPTTSADTKLAPLRSSASRRAGIRSLSAFETGASLLPDRRQVENDRAQVERSPPSVRC
jgi:hypothetical protein